VLKGAYLFLKLLQSKPVFLNSIVIVYRPWINASCYYGANILLV
jgi:hypothetical protein